MASQASINENQMTYSGWPENLRAEDMGVANKLQIITKLIEVIIIDNKAVANTLFLSFCNCEKWNNAVSMP